MGREDDLKAYLDIRWFFRGHLVPLTRSLEAPMTTGVLQGPSWFRHLGTCSALGASWGPLLDPSDP